MPHKILFVIGLALFVVLATYLVFFNEERAASPSTGQLFTGSVAR